MEAKTTGIVEDTGQHSDPFEWTGGTFETAAAEAHQRLVLRELIGANRYIMTESRVDAILDRLDRKFREDLHCVQEDDTEDSIRGIIRAAAARSAAQWFDPHTFGAGGISRETVEEVLRERIPS